MTEATDATALPGRVCPMRYRYGAAALATAQQRRAQTLYVVGGLYGNVPALDAIEAMVRAEAESATLCFNGDFNWFNVADRQFAEVNRRVLARDAIQGNVEAEFGPAQDGAGCGCAYPDSVDAATVERSNAIHARLKATTARHPDLQLRIAQLPMFARYAVADCRIGVVHGDADSLAGWRFDVAALDEPDHLPWLRAAFDVAQVDLFASTHTCLPALRCFDRTDRRLGVVINNGAAGMPNFSGDLAGLCTRIGTSASPHPVVHEVRIAGAYVALLRVPFDAERWQAMFLDQWPAGSPAWQSYFDRIRRGPAFATTQATGARAPNGQFALG